MFLNLRICLLTVSVILNSISLWMLENRVGSLEEKVRGGEDER